MAFCRDCRDTKQPCRRNASVPGEFGPERAVSSRLDAARRLSRGPVNPSEHGGALNLGSDYPVSTLLDCFGGSRGQRIVAALVGCVIVNGEAELLQLTAYWVVGEPWSCA